MVSALVAPFRVRGQGAISRKPRKLFGPVKPLQNLEPCDYRAVLFTYSKDEGRFPSYKKFPFLDTDDLKMAFRAGKLSGAFEKRAPGREHCVAFLDKTLTFHSVSLHPVVQMGTGKFCWG